MQTNIQTNMTLDTVKFLRNMMVEIKKSVDYAYPVQLGYPNGAFDSDRGHTALSMVNAKAKSVIEFLDALNVVEEVK